jgi:hypothetical protein
VFSHEIPGRQRHYEVSQVKSGVHNPGLPAIQIEGELKVPDQGAVQAVGDAPKEKQAANEGEWQKVGVSGVGLRMVGHAIFILLPAMLEKKYFPDAFFRKRSYDTITKPSRFSNRGS